MESWKESHTGDTAMRNHRFSRFCEIIPRNGSVLPRLATAALLALHLVSHAAPAPGDDFKAGQKAYQSGDMVGATTLLRRAADAGHAPAQALYASILDDAEYNQEALEWFRKAAAQRDADGEYGLGRMYLAGDGVAKDAPQAYALLARAGDKDHPAAILALAGAHVLVYRGEQREGPDPARAGEWLRKAAALNHLPSLETLAAAYRDGGLGLKPDAAEAARYAAQAEAVRKKMNPPAAVQKKKRPRV